MFADLRFTVRQRISDWIFRARVPEAPPVTLVQRRIFILPTRTGLVFALVLLVIMLIASINYALSLGFILTFLLAGVGGMAMLHTFRNLARLSIRPGKAEPVFAGQTAQFGILISNPSMPRFAVGVKRTQIPQAEPEFGDVGMGDDCLFQIPVAAPRRGRVHCGRLEIFTEYPVGLFHAWSYVDFGMSTIVYPKPEPGDGALPLHEQIGGEGNVQVKGDEEFQSLRSYRAGDTPRQIAWKALAREQGLVSKEFGRTASADLWLDFDRLSGLPVEQRLSRLTWWVLEAERLQLPYGLKLPGTSFRPAIGPAHRQVCLEALALHGVSDD